MPPQPAHVPGPNPRSTPQSTGRQSFILGSDRISCAPLAQNAGLQVTLLESGRREIFDICSPTGQAALSAVLGQIDAANRASFGFAIDPQVVAGYFTAIRDIASREQPPAAPPPAPAPANPPFAPVAVPVLLPPPAVQHEQLSLRSGAVITLKIENGALDLISISHPIGTRISFRALGKIQGQTLRDVKQQLTALSRARPQDVVAYLEQLVPTVSGQMVVDDAHCDSGQALRQLCANLNLNYDIRPRPHDLTAIDVLSGHFSARISPDYHCEDSWGTMVMNVADGEGAVHLDASLAQAPHTASRRKNPHPQADPSIDFAFHTSALCSDTAFSTIMQLAEAYHRDQSAGDLSIGCSAVFNTALLHQNGMRLSRAEHLLIKGATVVNADFSDAVITPDCVIRDSVMLVANADRLHLSARLENLYLRLISSQGLIIDGPISCTVYLAGRPENAVFVAGPSGQVRGRANRCNVNLSQADSLQGVCFQARRFDWSIRGDAFFLGWAYRNCLVQVEKIDSGRNPVLAGLTREFSEKDPRSKAQDRVWTARRMAGRLCDDAPPGSVGRMHRQGRLLPADTAGLNAADAAVLLGKDLIDIQPPVFRTGLVQLILLDDNKTRICDRRQNPPLLSRELNGAPEMLEALLPLLRGELLPGPTPQFPAQAGQRGARRPGRRK